MPRIDKLLAERTQLGRKLARQRVQQGRVRLGMSPDEAEVLRDPKTNIPVESLLWLDGEALPPPPDLVILHKPLGVLSTTQDPRGRRCLADPDVAGRLLELGLHPVGRLDADTDGLLPFSRHGAWTHHLLHPRHQVEKVYVAHVEGHPGQAVVERLAAGVQTAEGVHTARVIELEEDAARITLGVREGKHRMVRRMLHNIGHSVVSLRRVAFGALTLGDLPPGAWRAATSDELRWLKERLAG